MTRLTSPGTPFSPERGNPDAPWPTWRQWAALAAFAALFLGPITLTVYLVAR